MGVWEVRYWGKDLRISIVAEVEGGQRHFWFRVSQARLCQGHVSIVLWRDFKDFRILGDQGNGMRSTR
jgi:hypothetical protein